MKKTFFLFLLLAWSTVLSAQQIVKGTVADTKGGALPGVSIIVTGTTQGTTTDISGKYTIEVPQGSKSLTFTFIGMKRQEVSIGSRSSIDVVMEEEITGLEEVVVTALGIKRAEKALGYSVQKVDGKSIQKVSGIDVASSLTGKVAGLLVRNTADFNSVAVITIRGELPLLVIDGVAYQNKTLSDISSEDIESMSVLKGATASALYGFRGASGAILVTTKKGTTNNLTGLSVDFANNTMFGAGFIAVPVKQSTYGRGGANIYDKNSDASWGVLMDGTIRNQWDPKLKAYADYAYLPTGKDNFANFLEQSYITNNNLSVGYKGDVASVRSSVNWVQNTGVYPNQKANHYTYSLGGDINLDKLKLSSNMSYSKNVTPNMSTNAYTGYDPMYSLLVWGPSDFNILDYKDNYWIKPHETQNYTLGNENNPYFNIHERTNEVHRDIFNVDLSVSYQLTDWLKASVRSGADYYTDKGELRIAWGSRTSSGSSPIPGNLYTWVGGVTGGYMLGQTQGLSINTDFLLTGDRSFDKFKVEYLVGGTIYYKLDDNIQGWTNGGISVPDFYSLKASVSPVGASTYTRGQQVNSVYGRFIMSYNKLVYLEATGRNDWSSTMVNTQAESYFYPSVSASFVVSELLPGTKSWLDLLKVRGSWTMSKTPAGIYETTVNSAFGINSATWNTLNGAYAPSSLYGSDLLPQSATTFEVGLQGMFFKSRLNFDVTYYDKHIYDFVKSAPLSGASGYTGKYINIDEEQSRRGWEIALSGAIVKTQDLQWDMGANLSSYARYYTKIDATYSPKNAWVAVGQRVDAMVIRDYMRDPATGKKVWQNGILQFNPYDTKGGNIDPDFIWGINSTLRYKNFSLFASLDGVKGGHMNSSTEGFMWRSGVHPESVTPERALDVATPGSKNYLGDGVKVVSGTFAYDSYGNITSDTRVFAPNDVYSTYMAYAGAMHSNSVWGARTVPADMHEKTFFKLREIALTYNLPGKFTKKWAKAASVSLVGQNVLLWAKDFKYSDPDSGGYAPWGNGANATGTAEDMTDPALRYLGFNIKLTF